MSAIRGIACSRAESMIWERSQAPPENKDSYIHWSVQPAGTAALANPRRTCWRRRRGWDVRRRWRLTTTTSKSERTLACLIDGATPSCAATEAGELSLVKELHFILRAHTIVTLYVIINIIVIIIVKRENHLVQTHSRIDRIFIVYLVSAIIQTRLKKLENSMLHELTYYPIYLFFHSC